MISSLKKLFKPIDLTKGSPFKVILLFTIPILISNLVQQVYSLTDAIIVGQTIPAQFAGINDTNPLVFLILQFAFGTTSGLSVAFSTYFGKQDYDKLRKSIAISILICLGTSIILTILSLTLVDYLLAAVGLNIAVDEITFTAAKIYIMTLCSGMIAQIAYNLIINISRSIGDSITPLLFLILSSAINIGLDILFASTFPTPEAKVFGVAFATILAQALSAILCFIYTFHKYKFLRLKKEDFKFDFKEFYYHIKISIPLGVQFSVLAIGIVIMQNTIVAFDTSKIVGNFIPHYAQDAYGAACKFQQFLNTSYIALGSSMVTYVASNNGSNDKNRIIKGIKSSFLLGFIMYVICAGIGMLSTINGGFLYLFLKESQITSETIKYGSTYLLICMPCAYILVILFITRNSLQGLGKPMFPFIGGIAELVARILVCLFIPVLINKVDPYCFNSYIGVVFADPLAWLAADLIFVPALFIELKKLK